jgi:hypothetical protein
LLAANPDRTVFPIDREPREPAQPLSLTGALDPIIEQLTRSGVTG